MRRVLPIALLAVLTSVILNAQGDPQAPRATFRGRSDLIPVDVSVLDQNRQPVRGLSAADFTVLEDGKPRPVVAFAAVDLPVVTPAATEASWVRDAPFDVIANDRPDEGRLVAILMDGTISAGSATIVAKQIAQAAVDALGAGDLAAVVRSSIFGSDGLSQGFTADRARLREAIDSPFIGTTNPPEMTPTGLQSPSPVPGSALYTRSQCEVVRDIARAMRDAPGRRKLLIFVGTSLYLSGQLNSGGDIRQCRDEALRELGQANVTVHVIDPTGLLTTAVMADYITQQRVQPNLEQGWARQNQSRIDALKMLPSLTGGRAVANMNTPQTVMPAVIAESQRYYLLGFEPAAAAGARTSHSIKVEVRRRGVTVHARSGYESPKRPGATSTVPPVPPANSSAPAADIARALDGPLPRQDLRLAISATPFAGTDARKARVAVALGVALAEGSSAIELNVTVAAFDVNGKSVDVSRELLTIPESATRRGQVDEGLLARLDLPPGRYELRAAVRDERSGALGSVFSFIDVPAFSKEPLTGSSLLLHRDRATTVGGNPLAGILPIVPTLARVLSPSEKLSAFLRLRQSGPPEAVNVTIRIVDTADRSVHERVVELTRGDFKGGSADLDLPLPLDTLAAGRYLLTTAASLGQTRIERTMRFSVQR